MKNDVQKFIDCLDEAMQMLDDQPNARSSDNDLKLEYTPSEQFDLTLFEQWSELCTPAVQKKPPIRTIHHLSCTGGTLISRCLAAMPNVSLFSEVNPLCPMDDVHRSGFAPTDLTYLAKQINFPMIDEVSKEIFKADINIFLEYASQLGRYLVLREHSHSTYHHNDLAEPCSNIKTLLEKDNSLLSIVTVRHPTDSYLSMVNNGWIQFEPKSLNEYCRRYLRFLEDYAGVDIFKYEDFVDDSTQQLERMCEVLALPFNEDFQDVFDLNRLSGDSGRSSNVISKRSRREYDEAFCDEAEKSDMYADLCKQLGYDPDLRSQGEPD